MDFKSATTRLRRTFAYPSDTTTTSPSSSRHLSDDDDDDDDFFGPALDEQEQEELIQSLAAQNAVRNAQFRLFLFTLPALSTIPYLIILGSGLSGLLSSSSRDRDKSSSSAPRAADIQIAILALSSLASTAWTLWSLPPGVTGLRVLDAWVGGRDGSASLTNPSSGTPGGVGLVMGANAQRRRRLTTDSPFFWAHSHRSPLQHYLSFLNVALCVLLVVAGLLSSQRSAAAQHWGHVGLANLPPLIYVVVLVAKMLMGSIDPERELSALQYEYKGA
ncbi:hypothetical protein GGR51DRAFT_304893 [Nemania sp. FL0031]|nr:hypothetical protein GGR51DRAFT_304893 [Nemania sp. FL0031]